tara:strand:- start:3629 stop:4231 length:603 start_codon:yes stop_codon:yes gene_type:complete
LSLFIVFEGIDGSGKSTQVDLLAQNLESNNKEHSIVREPGGTSIGELIRTELKNSPNLEPLTQLLLFSACRSELLAKIIIPKINHEQIVICDRYIYSTIAYQGYAQGLNLSLINTVINLSTQDLEPDLVIFIDTPVEIAKERRKETSSDYYDSKNADFHERIRTGYLSMAHSSSKWVTIDGSQNAQQISNIIWEKIKPLI